MNESHKSYSHDFEASNEDVDSIVNNSIDCGALGARLTGGGFGGSGTSLFDLARPGGGFTGSPLGL